tara:strand:+ start:1434 stop:1718 length:285 start_codon:yes stop_codon:yes gene_type:complete
MRKTKISCTVVEQKPEPQDYPFTLTVEGLSKADVADLYHFCTMGLGYESSLRRVFDKMYAALHGLVPKGDFPKPVGFKTLGEGDAHYVWFNERD